MKHQEPDDFELFYQELPQSDYLDDIELDDEVEDSVVDSTQGLSEEQVSEIARDSLDQRYSPTDARHNADSDNQSVEQE